MVSLILMPSSSANLAKNMSNEKGGLSEDEMAGLLKPIVLKQYKALEDSIRNVYREITSLELPEIDPAKINDILGKEIPQKIPQEFKDTVFRRVKTRVKSSRKLGILSTTFKDTSAQKQSELDSSTILKLTLKDVILHPTESDLLESSRNISNENGKTEDSLSKVELHRIKNIPSEIDGKSIFK